MNMGKLAVMTAAAAMAATSFASCSSGGGGDSRTIEVDYHSDDFAGAFLGYYPNRVTVRPGMTVKFHQNWSGEPHSVSFGSAIDAKIKPVSALIRGIHDGTVEDPGEPPPEFDQEFFFNRMPSLFRDDSDGLAQDAAQPCYAKTLDELPLDHTACSKADQKQPEFTGRLAYYSSGFIPFEGEGGNTYEVKIADNAKPGTYFYYCNVHGVLMSGEITVAKKAKVESQAALNRRGKAEADRLSKPLLAAYRKELAGNGQFKGNLAGSGDDSTESVEGIVNEFTPRTINAKVGEKVTWTFIGNHTISFNVPPYTPLFVFDKNGKVSSNQGLDKPKGGWPGVPAGHESHDDGPPPPPVHLDAGDFDGSGGLKSSGTGFNTGDTYSVTFTKAGTYPYACLIHPGMIGKVVVK
jgi:plastocyanin